jgi:Arc/MetJ-type ribon-helix-helix transcriptional regulator
VAGDDTTGSAPSAPSARLRGWFAGQIPDGWFRAEPSIQVDREEILVIGALPEPALGDDADDVARAAACRSRIQRFREDTREDRMAIADRAEHRTGLKVSWGATCGDLTVLFTTQSVPVMTRLRMPERQVLDTLVVGGVARSRSEALNWCVRLVRDHQGEWIDALRDALKDVERVRSDGPNPGGPTDADPAGGPEHDPRRRPRKRARPG